MIHASLVPVPALSRVLMGDEVELHNGDRLLGTVVEQTADSVVLDHPALGRLVIDADLVRAVRLDSDPAPPPPPPPAEGRPADYFDLRLKMGGGGRREFGSLNDGLEPEGILGGELAWQVSPRQRLAVSSTIYPDFGETGEFRLVTDAEWVLQIDKLDGVNFKLGLAHEYQSLTDPGVDHNDLSIYGALVIDF